MSTQKPIQCIVDDTALTTNLDEIGPWVQTGLVALVVPLYTLERLHLLKKDASQIGQNARKAVKFLDQITSATGLSHDPVVIQGPDDQYLLWPDVESRYAASVIQKHVQEGAAGLESGRDQHVSPSPVMIRGLLKESTASPEKLINDLSLSSDDVKTSPVSTPPLSPSASDPQSAKTSPEIQSATITKHHATPVPPTLKPLINYVVWYNYERKNHDAGEDLIFLTNSADAAQIAKDFSITPKTIHQLRASISTEQNQPPKNIQPKQKKKKKNRSSSFKSDAEPRTLFRYDEVSSDDEELLFKPRPRDLQRPGSAGRGHSNTSHRGRGATHSPSNSINAPPKPKPQVPVEEIDPDSFDRGTFARGSTPLANVGNHYGPPNTNGPTRGGQRNFNASPQRGTGFRGNTFRGRGRGRLFVP